MLLLHPAFINFLSCFLSLTPHTPEVTSHMSLEWTEIQTKKKKKGIKKIRTHLVAPSRIKQTPNLRLFFHFYVNTEEKGVLLFTQTISSLKMVPGPSVVA